tara:strand:- start:1503 stop:2192 length:690 start_codon:yes stop_codon:yes gene_type:complete
MPDPQSRPASPRAQALERIMPRHAPFYFSLAAGVLALVAGLVLTPKFAVSIGANALFMVYLALAAIKLPRLSADYLRAHARDEDTPSGGIFLIVLIVVGASVVSLFLALNGEKPDAAEMVLSVASVLLGWFTVQAVGASHYAYEYYQAPETSGEREVVGGLDFPGDEEPDGTAFMYFSFTVGTSVATSDTKATSNAMRRRLTVHLVFSHLYNTIILAAAVNVMMSGSGS